MITTYMMRDGFGIMNEFTSEPRPHMIHHEYALPDRPGIPNVTKSSEHVIQYPAAVAYIVRDDGLMLAVTRKDTKELSAPGGKCKPNESLHRALKREMYEEVGLQPIHWHLVYDAQHMGRRVVAYRINEWRGVPHAWEHGTRIAWITPEVMASSFGADYHRRALMACKLIRTSS